MIEIIKKKAENCRNILNAILQDEYGSDEIFEKRIERLKSRFMLEETYLIDDICLAYEAIEETALGCEDCPFKECEGFVHQNAVKYDALTAAYVALKAYYSGHSLTAATLAELSSAFDSMKSCTKERIKRINKNDFEKVYGEKKFPEDNSDNWFNRFGNF